MHDSPPFLVGAKNGSFTIPTSGETSADVHYRLILVVTDAGGIRTTTYREIFPRKSTINLATSPAGLQLSIEGAAQTTPFATVGVEGFVRTINAPSTQTVGGVTYEFVSWSDGGAQSHTIVTPTDDVTYTATFRPVTAGALRTPENPANAVAGLNYAYYEGSWGAVPNFGTLTAVRTGTTSDVNLTPRRRDDNFAMRYTGYVTVPADGTYTFYTASDDGSQLFIGSTLVVNNDGQHGTREKSGTIGLKAGVHAITVTFFEAGGDQVLNASYAGPGLAKTPIPAAALSHTGAARGAASATSTPGANPALAVQLYPNPARNYVTINLQVAVAQEARVEVYDNMGRRVASLKQATHIGVNELHLPLNQLPSGVYSITVLHGAERSTQRLVMAK